MAQHDSYSGTDRVVLPKDYLESVDAALELYDERLDVHVDLNVDGLKPRLITTCLKRLLPTLVVWLIPTSCL